MGSTQATTTRTVLGAASPFFIVGDLERSLGFYKDRLGFEVTFKGPDNNPFFGIVRRDAAQLLLKVCGDSDETIEPLPNRQRHPQARWDAFVASADPDALAAEFEGRGVALSSPLSDTADGLRGFEVTDTDGYVLFFGCPAEP